MTGSSNNSGKANDEEKGGRGLRQRESNAQYRETLNEIGAQDQRSAVDTIGKGAGYAAQKRTQDQVTDRHDTHHFCAAGCLQHPEA
ncbi:hypothetical protein D3C81_1679000 [compost metagenome]